MVRWLLLVLCVAAAGCATNGDEEPKDPVAERILELEKAATAAPADARAQYTLGNAYFDAQRYPEARGSYLRATELDATFADAYTKRDIMWMIIPNKTTVYVRPEHSKDFVTALKQNGAGPDLFTFGLEEKSKVRDFFFPNDTHLSMHGQLVLGQRMLEAVKQIMPPPSAKPS